MRSPGAELRKASSRRGYLHPFKSFSTSRVPLRVQPSPSREEKLKPKKESGGFFSQLRRSFTLGHRSSSSREAAAAAAAAAAPEAPASSSTKDGLAAPPSPAWGKRVKHGLSMPLKIVRTSYVDCMMGMAENPRVDGLAGMGFQNPNTSAAYAFQSSASRRLQHSSSSAASSDELELAYPSDAQLHAVLRSSRRHARSVSSV